MTARTVLFRADASLEIGTGHVMRCLALADAMQERGMRALFVSRMHAGNLLDEIRRRGHEARPLPAVPASADAPAAAGPAHAGWLGCRWEIDAAQTLEALGGLPVDWLVADHYALDARWERRLRPACRRLLVIDDLADRPHDADLLLDQNLGSVPGRYQGLVPGNCDTLLGPRHALLRPEFAALREASLARRRQPRLRQLLVNLGGVDKDNATSAVLDGLAASALPEECAATVVMGAKSPWIEQVRERARTLPFPATVLAGIGHMAQLMAGCDLAVGAAGSTSWERCTLGLPTLLVILAENQRAAARALEDAGAARVLGAEAPLHGQLAEALRTLREQPDLLGAMARAAAAVCDGRGTARVAARMLEG